MLENSPLPDLQLIAPPPREELQRLLLPRLPDVVPGMRLLARDLLAAEGRIDFVALEPNGRVVVILVSTDEDDLEQIGQALAHRAWVEPRLQDWLQLAPSLGVRPDRGVGALLLCHTVRPETVAAAASLGGAIALARYRCVRSEAGVEALVEREGVPEPPTPAREIPSETPPFRTGLSDADLDLTDAERREFDPQGGDKFRHR